VRVEANEVDTTVVLVQGSGAATFRHLWFADNGAGGVLASSGIQALGSLTLDNAVFAGNALDGSGDLVQAEAAGSSVRNVTISGNVHAGRAALRGFAGVTLADNVVTDNAGIGIQADAAATVAYNAVSGNQTNLQAPSATDTVRADPLFADAAARDFTLLPTSPAIDAGDPARTDPDGSRADLGAYGGPGAIWP
jgi:hypothetical protein